MFNMRGGKFGTFAAPTRAKIVGQFFALSFTPASSSVNSIPAASRADFRGQPGRPRLPVTSQAAVARSDLFPGDHARGLCAVARGTYRSAFSQPDAGRPCFAAAYPFWVTCHGSSLLRSLARGAAHIAPQSRRAPARRPRPEVRGGRFRKRDMWRTPRGFEHPVGVRHLRDYFFHS
jgi:hypothetical protein